MQTLYGLTETQMWEVYRACRLEGWKELVIELAQDHDECTTFDDWDFENIADNACDMALGSDVIGSEENEIAHQAIEEWLDAEYRTKDEEA